MNDETIVIEVQTVERVVRNYNVELRLDEHEGYDDNELKVRAEEMVRAGDESKFSEGDADIEEVLRVELRP